MIISITGFWLLAFAPDLCETLILYTLPLVGLEIFKIAGKSITLPILLTLPLFFNILVLPFISGRTQELKFIRPSIFSVFFILFIITGIFSAQYNAFTDYSLFLTTKNISQTGYAFLALICFFVFRARIMEQGRVSLHKYIRAFVFTAGLHSVYAIVQVLGAHLFHHVIDLFRTANIYSHFRPDSVSRGWNGLFRISGTFPEPVMASAFTLFAIFLINPITFKNTPKWLISLLKGLLYTAGFITCSRTFFIILLTGHTLFHVISFISKSAYSVNKIIKLKTTIILVITIALFAGFAGLHFNGYIIGNDGYLTNFLKKSQITSDSSVKNRSQDFYETINALKNAPFIGFGLGNFNRTRSQFAIEKGPFASDNVACSSSWFLVCLQETGLLGTIFFTLSFIFLFFEILRSALSIRPELSSIAKDQPQNEKQACEDQASEYQFFLFRMACLVPCIFMYWVGYGGINFTFIWLCLAIVSAGPDLIKNEHL